MRPGVRVPYWLSMLDAIGREPLLGYGWQQVGIAQQRVALDHPGVGSLFDHSHNLVLDLLLWSGIPIGSLIVAVLASWFLVHVRACRDARVVWMLAAVGGVFAHSMVEFPLQYAYFLIPMGVWIGAVDALNPPVRPLQVGSWWLRVGMALYASLLLVVANDYLKAEQGHRLLRLESSGIGVSGITTPPPELALLTQLSAFQRLAQTEARPGMTDAQVDWMRKVSERYGYPPVMFRYALAAGLNGHKSEAALTLVRLCRIHPKERCEEARNAWPDLRRRYPELNAVPMP